MQGEQHPTINVANQCKPKIQEKGNKLLLCRLCRDCLTNRMIQIISLLGLTQQTAKLKMLIIRWLGVTLRVIRRWLWWSLWRLCTQQARIRFGRYLGSSLKAVSSSLRVVGNNLRRKSDRILWISWRGSSLRHYRLSIIDSISII